MPRYIDAQKMENAMIIEDDTNGYFNIITALQCVDEAPTANVQEVRHGRWIREVKEIEDTVYFKAFCSVCNRRVIVKYNYCPHCGAKMDEEEV